MKRLFLLPLLTFALALCLGVQLLAADTLSATPPGFATSQPATWLQMIIPAVVPVAIAGLKWVFPKVPRPILPVLAPLLGAAIEILGHYAGATSGNLVTGLILGAVGVFVREAYDQARKALTPGNGVIPNL